MPAPQNGQTHPNNPSGKGSRLLADVLFLSQSTFTFSNLTIETLEQGVNYVQSVSLF